MMRNTMGVHIDAFVDPNGSGASQAAAFVAIKKLLRDGTITLQNIIAGAGKYLTSTDKSVRARGVLLLGDLLATFSSTPLVDTVIHSLATFFTAKLADWHCLQGTLIGCTALLRRSSEYGVVEGNDVQSMAKSMLDNICVRPLKIDDRLLSLELFECLMNDHGSSIIPLGAELIRGVCVVTENETDPRCLLVAFRLVEHVGQLFPTPNGPLAIMAEDLFSVIRCYFPVSFTPPPDDTLGISRDDLAEALLKAFASTTLFAQACIYLFVEKLSSSLKRAKLDSLRYLGLCVLSYGPKDIIDDNYAIWMALKEEILPASDSESLSATQNRDAELREEALIALTRYVKAFEKGKEGDDIKPSTEILRTICGDVCIQDLLKYVENDFRSKSGGGMVTTRAKEQMQAIGCMLAAAMKASSSSCYVLTETILGRLLSATGVLSPSPQEDVSSDSPLTTAHSQFLGVPPLSICGLEVVIQILEAASTVAKTVASSNSASDSISVKWLKPIRSKASNLLLIFSQIAVGQVSRTESLSLGVAGLQALASFPASMPVLKDDELVASLSTLVGILLDDSCTTKLRDKVHEAIFAISTVEEQFTPFVNGAPFPVLDTLIPKFLAAIRQGQTKSSLKPPLQALAKVGGPRPAARLAILDGTRSIIAMDWRVVMEDPNELASRRLVAMLECLSEHIIPLCEKGSADERAACNIILDMWDIIRPGSSAGIGISEEVLCALMTASRVTFRQCPENLQKEVFCRATSVLLRQDVVDVVDAPHTVIQQEATHLLFPTVTSLQERGWQVSLVASLAIGLLPTVVSQHKLLLKIFVMSSILDGGSAQTCAAAQATASILNKWKDESEVERLDGTMGPISEAINEVDEVLMPIMNLYLSAADGNLHVEKILRAVFTLAWVGKGLAMRGHAHVGDIAAIFLKCLQSEGLRHATLKDSGEEIGFPSPESAIPLGAAARCFGIIMKDSEICLNRVHNAVVKPLYKQRFFTSMLPPLQDAISVAGNRSYRIWFFRAFAHLLSGAPHAAVLTEGKKVFPLVLEGLSTLCYHSQDSDLLRTTLLTLSSFLTDDKYGRKIAAEHIPAVVNRVANLVQYRSSWVIRETALQSLGAIVGLPFTRVFPVKRQVLEAVNLALDDNKRAVRTEAVRCRQVWSAISS